ncbi:hypothetical protein B0H14DRAFT_2581408 [Mycena olivaceomarginata]|nr:hypothetical protein B0H14DRAFT_2581408 [Mycena olivaceomarginata]
MPDLRSVSDSESEAESLESSHLPGDVRETFENRLHTLHRIFDRLDLQPKVVVSELVSMKDPPRQESRFDLCRVSVDDFTIWDEAGFSSWWGIIFVPLGAWVKLIIGLIFYTLDVRVQLTDLAIYAGFSSSQEILFLALEAWAQLLTNIIFYAVDARVQLIDLTVHDNIIWSRMDDAINSLGF